MAVKLAIEVMATQVYQRYEGTMKSVVIPNVTPKRYRERTLFSRAVKTVAVLGVVVEEMDDPSAVASKGSTEADLTMV